MILINITTLNSCYDQNVTQFRVCCKTVLVINSLNLPLCLSFTYGLIIKLTICLFEICINVFNANH